MKILKLMAQNKHTSAAAIIGFITAALPIFFPEWKVKCDELFRLAVVYGLATARDAALPAELRDQKNQREDHARRRLPILIGAGLVCLAISLLTGCASIKKNPATAERVSDHVAYDIAVVMLDSHPNWRPQFQKAHDDLQVLELQPAFDTIAVIEILQRLPVKELATPTARIGFDGAMLLVQLIGNPTVNPADQEALRVVVRGLRTGLERRLAEPDRPVVVNPSVFLPNTNLPPVPPNK